MFSLVRLPVERQRAVGQQLADFLKQNKTAKVDRAVAESAADVVRLTLPLKIQGRNAKLVVDNAADQVAAALHQCVSAIARGLTDKVVPLTPAGKTMLTAANKVLASAFAGGLGYLAQEMSLEYTALRALVDALDEKSTAAAVKQLGLGYLVDHLRAHLAPYGRAVKGAGGQDVEAASDAWHAAYEGFAVQVRARYASDPAMQAKLLGAYERELTAHRTRERAQRAARAAKKKKPDA